MKRAGTPKPSAAKKTKAKKAPARKSGAARAKVGADPFQMMLENLDEATLEMMREALEKKFGIEPGGLDELGTDLPNCFRNISRIARTTGSRRTNATSASPFSPTNSRSCASTPTAAIPTRPGIARCHRDARGRRGGRQAPRDRSDDDREGSRRRRHRRARYD